MKEESGRSSIDGLKWYEHNKAKLKGAVIMTNDKSYDFVFKALEQRRGEDLEPIVSYSNMIDDYVMYNQSRKAREAIKALAKELGRNDVSDIAERKKWYLDSLTVEYSHHLRTHVR